MAERNGLKHKVDADRQASWSGWLKVLKELLCFEVVDQLVSVLIDSREIGL